MCMVGAGERGGLLSEILARLATYLENTARLRKKVKSAMMYPTAVTIIAIGITIFLLVKVVPVFGDVYKGFGQRLPGPTLALINLSNLVRDYILYIIPATSVLGAILLTGYLGGAVATHVRVGEGLFPVLFPVIVGVLLWLGVYLRDDRLRTLVPLRS